MVTHCSVVIPVVMFKKTCTLVRGDMTLLSLTESGPVLVGKGSTNGCDRTLKDF